MTLSRHFQTLLRRQGISVSVFLLLLLSSCAVTDFVSQRYENSVAYFNTYYNASRLFDEAVLEIETTEKAQRSRGLPPQKEISQTVRQKFTTVIEKCSKLLQYHPNSKWVDDALMLIGKSYYYEGEYPKAERKFAELIAQFPNSDHFLEARLWLGKSFRGANDLDKAIRELSSVAETAIAESEKGIAEEALLALGELNVERKSFDEAVKAYQDLVNHSDSEERKAEAQFRIAELHENAREYEKAAEAYRKVPNLKSDPSVSYAARFRYAVNANRTKKHEEALRVLYALLDDRANIVFYPQIKLEIARVLHDKGEINNAIEAYGIIDTSYARTEVASKAYYQLGLIYEKDLRHYAVAETNYVRARVEFPSSEVVNLASRRAENLQRYSNFKRLIKDSDSLLVREEEKLRKEEEERSSPQPDSLRDSLSVRNPGQLKSPQETAIGRSKSDTLKSSASDSLSMQKIDSVKVQAQLGKREQMQLAIRGLKLTLARHTYELGVLFFLDLEEPDSALHWCERSAAIAPDSELASRALYTLAEVHRSTNPENQSVVDSLYREIIADYPNTTYADAVKRVIGLEVKKEEIDPAAAAYRVGETYLQQNKTTDAVEVLKKLVNDYPASPYSPKSQYAIGWIYENIEGRPDSARENYARLTKLFPSSTYAAAVRPKLAEAERLAMEEKMRRDSIAAHVGKEQMEVLKDSVSVQKMITPSDSTSRLKLPIDEAEKRKNRFDEKEVKDTVKTKADTLKRREE